MDVDRFKAWERQCLREAVTNAVRLLQQRPAAASAATSPDRQTQDTAGRADTRLASGGTST